MTTFQIISIIISGLVLLILIIGIYVKLKGDVIEIKTIVHGIEKGNNRKGHALIIMEKNNRDDHQKMIKKIDKTLKTLNKKDR